MSNSPNSSASDWPQLVNAEWEETRATLHLWTQIVGKIRTRNMPWINHSWHVTLYVTPRGLTTLAIPAGRRSFQVDFDFLDHRLEISASDGRAITFDLKPMTVADFHAKVKAALAELDLPTGYHGAPNEVEQATPFHSDTEHASYDADHVERLHRALVLTDSMMQQFRAGFRGKCSPVHFFWGSFDMAVTRFSGRIAPPHPGGFPNMPDWITREAYSHEVSSAGFWPGGGGAEAIFYSYAYPAPAGYADQPARPEAGVYSQDMQEFILPYAAVQSSPTPEADLLAFFESTYEAAAYCAGWDREALEWNGPAKS